MSASEEKKVVPDPPCCKIACCRDNFNDNCLCAGLGRVGLTIMDENRRWIMRTMTVMAVVATVLSIIPVVSMSSDKDVVKDTYWTYAKATDNSEFYFSISVVVAEAYGPNNTYIDDKFRWDSDDCREWGEGEDYCDDCGDASFACRRTVIVNMITIWLTISSNYKRSDRGSDLNFTKFMAILTGTISSIVMLSSLATYSEQCYSELPDHTQAGLSLDYEYGPGFICLVFPQVFKLIEVVFNLLTPVPQKLRPILESLSEPLSPNDSYSDF